MSVSTMNLNGLIKDLDKLSDLDLRRAVGRGISIVQQAAKLGVHVQNGELRNSIFTDVREQDGKVIGTCYTNKRYANYVEFGTGPRGQANHEGISPNVAVAYEQSPWWIHEGSGQNEVDRDTAERYGWFHIDTPQGRFYQCTGSEAHPFMYPALKNNEEIIVKEMSRYTQEAIGRR
ncbi:MAG: HK97 gp10 family phage protein [Lachnospiraceae bacterium]|nr:HK97 gp10 family phage protein [Lachnospiraceae bacterium]